MSIEGNNPGDNTSLLDYTEIPIQSKLSTNSSVYTSTYIISMTLVVLCLYAIL